MPTNPWKPISLLLAALLVISHASADATSDRRASALAQLRSAAALLEQDLPATKGGKIHEKPGDKAAGATAKALDLTRAAIVHLERVIKAP